MFEDSLITKLQGTKVEEKMCSECKHKRYSFSIFSSLSIQLAQSKDQRLIDLIDESLGQKSTERYLCQNCGCTGTLLTMDHIIEYPPLLFVYVNRIQWGAIAKKVQSAVLVDKNGNLDLTRYHLLGKMSNRVSNRARPFARDWVLLAEGIHRTLWRHRFRPLRRVSSARVRD